MQNSLPASIPTYFPLVWPPPGGLPQAVVKTTPNYAAFFDRFHSNLFSISLARSKGVGCILVKTMQNYAEFFSRFHSNLFSVVLVLSLWHGVGGG